MGVILAGTFMVVSKASRPYRISYSESKDITAKLQKLNKAQAENEVLKQDWEYLTNPQTQNEAMEIEARKLGWVKPGEIAIVVEQSPKALDEENKFPVSSWFSPGKRILGLFGHKDSDR